MEKDKWYGFPRAILFTYLYSFLSLSYLFTHALHPAYFHSKSGCTELIPHGGSDG